MSFVIQHISLFFTLYRMEFSKTVGRKTSEGKAIGKWRLKYLFLAIFESSHVPTLLLLFGLLIVFFLSEYPQTMYTGPSLQYNLLYLARIHFQFKSGFLSLSHWWHSHMHTKTGHRRLQKVLEKSSFEEHFEWASSQRGKVKQFFTHDLILISFFKNVTSASVQCEQLPDQEAFSS